MCARLSNFPQAFVLGHVKSFSFYDSILSFAFISVSIWLRTARSETNFQMDFYEESQAKNCEMANLPHFTNCKSLTKT